MEFLDAPTADMWNSRRAWFERMADVENRGGGYLVSEHALSLLMDVQVVFCAGAWSAVVVLSASVIDAHAKQVEGSDEQGGFQHSFAATGLADELDWLRLRRNALVHFKVGRSSLTVDDQWSRRNELEEEARRAVELIFEVIYQSPSI